MGLPQRFKIIVGNFESPLDTVLPDPGPEIAEQGGNFAVLNACAYFKPHVHARTCGMRENGGAAAARTMGIGGVATRGVDHVTGASHAMH